MGYLSSDAWILLAAVYAAREKAAPLADVIAAADRINYAVVVFEEMQGALARLTSGGYLVHSRGTILPTAKTLEFYRSVTMSRRSVMDEWEDMCAFLGAPKGDPQYKPEIASRGVSYPHLNRDAFDEAVQSYLALSPKIPGVRRRKDK